MDFKWINRLWPMAIVLFAGNYLAGWVTTFFGWSSSQGMASTAICYGILAFVVLKLMDILGKKRMSGDLDGS